VLFVDLLYFLDNSVALNLIFAKGLLRVKYKYHRVRPFQLCRSQVFEVETNQLSCV